MPMLVKLTLYTYLKNTDLQALSAYEAIHQTLDAPALKNIHRYSRYDIELKADDKTTATSALQKILNTTYYICNPNKEAYYIGKLPKPASSDTHKIVVKVDEKHPFSEAVRIERIRQKTGVQLTAIYHSQIWELSFDKDTKDLPQDTLTDPLVVSTSRQSGILANPISQTASLLKPDSVYH